MIINHGEVLTAKFGKIIQMKLRTEVECYNFSIMDVSVIVWRVSQLVADSPSG